LNLLVTGGAGFIGSNFVRRRRATQPHDRIVVLDALTYAGNLASLADVPNIDFVRADIADAKAVAEAISQYAVEAIVHFAAESHVDRSIAGPLAFVQTNVTGTAVLLEQARAAKIRRFVHVSTDEVYGDLGPDDPPFTERTPIQPRSPYSASKAGSDLLVRAYFETFKLPVLITRCSNNYGPYQFPEKLIPLMVVNALAGKELPVYGDGLNVRDWIHVEDHCAAVELVLEAGREGEVYNIGGRSERRNLDIVKRILVVLKKPESLIRMVKDRPGHDRRYAIDDTKMERELGWTRSKSFEDGLVDTIAWYQRNDVWLRGVTSGEYRKWIDRNYAGRGDA